MRAPDIDLSTAVWRKSSYSDGGANNCVEVAHNITATVPVRDSKTPHAPALVFPVHDWTTFIAALRNGALTG